MRLLPALVLAGLPCVTMAQGTLSDVQKAAQDASFAALSAEELGLPSDDALPKTAALALSKATEGASSDFDTDKVGGNATVAPPLAQRNKVPGTVPDPALTAGDLGTGPDGTKTANLTASRAEGRPSIYDEDKIDGNEPPPAPLTNRQKAASFPEIEFSHTDLGLPADPHAPKTADLAAFHAEAVPTAYDEDKITGNGESPAYGPDDGPLSDRQKQPSVLRDDTDPAAFGQPLGDTGKEADLGVSKSETAVSTIEDNDKIVGNPYIAPPLVSREKAPGVLPDPVADADMGQPALDVPKGDLVVSKLVDGRPGANDDDKIDGNPITAPPLAERSKAPAYEPATAGLSDAELGLPAASEAAKTEALADSKAQGAVVSAYDEDKIAGNTSQDPALTDDYLTDSYEDAPPAALVAQVRMQLNEPATREAMLAGVAAGGHAPIPVATAFLSFVGTLFDVPQVRDRMAEEIAGVFNDFGLTPDNPAALGRVAAEFIVAFGEAEALQGTARRSTDEQRAYLSAALRIADTLTPEQCSPFLDGSMDAAQQRRLMLGAVADWPQDDRNAMLTNRAAAIIAEVQGDPPVVPMPDESVQMVRQTLGAAALALIDAAGNGPALLSAFGNPFAASPADHCTVQKLIIGAALADTGSDADLAVRYLVEYGWQN